LIESRESRAVEVWVRLLRGHAACRRALSTQLQAEHSLTVNDYEALLLLSRAEGKLMRRVDLADGLQLTASGVTRLLDGLEQQGLVDKATCRSDGRVTYAKLTRRGLKKLEQASSSHIANVEALLEERYEQEELVLLADLLSRLPGGASNGGAGRS
jgi:DNA-binding MarR family transcriptional regulator